MYNKAKRHFMQVSICWLKRGGKMSLKQLLLGVFIIVILLTPTSEILAIDSAQDTTLTVSNETRTPHPQIMIYTPSDFIDLGFSGNGAESTPFVIEDLLITSVGQEAWDASCIRITGCPGIYYTIRNCMVSGSRGPWLEYAGISLLSGIAQIEDCEVLNCSVGIAAGGIPITIEDCRVWNCSESAIMVENSNNCTIASSRIELYYAEGLKASYSSNVNIHTNLFLCDPLSTKELGYHLWFEGCESIYVEDNEFRGGSANMVLFARNCIDLLVKNNEFTSDSDVAFYVISSNNTQVLDCTFEREVPSIHRPPLFHIGGVGMEPEHQTAWNAFVKNCTFTNFDKNSTITDCRFYNTSVIAAADSAKVLHNNFVNGSISTFFFVTDGVEIAHNTITQVEAMGIQDSGVNSYIHNNTLIGTGLADSVGIDLGNRSIVHLNTIRKFHYGISGPGSLCSGCIITNNTIQGNTVGLYLGQSTGENKIYYNCFIDNGQGADDNGHDNQWDDGVDVGNYWTEILFPGEYIVPGYALAVDRYAKPYRSFGEVIANNSVFLILASTGIVIVSLLAIRRRRKT
jgi:parallel beta-helix repeat protein